MIVNESLMIEASQAVLRGNDMGVFTKPGPNQYPHQWNWDSALIALGLSYFDLPRALKEIRSLLSGQWRDGMVPHVVYHNIPSDYFPGADFWQIESSPNAPEGKTTGLTQPPLLATIVRQIHEKTPIDAFLREVYPSLLNWHRWLHTSRDADGSGLACIVHPWESGTDDSPRWLEIMAEIKTTENMQFTRGDTRHVPARERPYPQDYERFIYLIDVLRKHAYDPQAILEKSPFLVQDVLFNAILFKADADLKALGQTMGMDTSEIDVWMARMAAVYNQRFWHDDDGLYYDFDLHHQKPIQVSTGITFLPLFAGLASQEQADHLLQAHYHHTDHYAINDQVHYRLTSASKSLSAWDPRRYWRGPVWIILNWLVYHGMLNYGFEAEAAELREDSLSLMEKSGFREYYDPRDGTGCGSTSFSWSAALAIDWLKRAN